MAEPMIDLDAFIIKPLHYQYATVLPQSNILPIQQARNKAHLYNYESNTEIGSLAWSCTSSSPLKPSFCRSSPNESLAMCCEEDVDFLADCNLSDVRCNTVTNNRKSNDGTPKTCNYDCLNLSSRNSHNEKDIVKLYSSKPRSAVVKSVSRTCLKQPLDAVIVWSRIRKCIIAKLGKTWDACAGNAISQRRPFFVKTFVKCVQRNQKKNIRLAKSILKKAMLLIRRSRTKRVSKAVIYNGTSKAECCNLNPCEPFSDVSTLLHENIIVNPLLPVNPVQQLQESERSVLSETTKIAEPIIMPTPVCNDIPSKMCHSVSSASHATKRILPCIVPVKRLVLPTSYRVGLEHSYAKLQSSIVGPQSYPSQPSSSISLTILNPSHINSGMSDTFSLINGRIADSLKEQTFMRKGVSYKCQLIFVPRQNHQHKVGASAKQLVSLTTSDQECGSRNSVVKHLDTVIDKHASAQRLVSLATAHQECRNPNSVINHQDTTIDNQDKSKIATSLSASDILCSAFVAGSVPKDACIYNKARELLSIKDIASNNIQYNSAPADGCEGQVSLHNLLSTNPLNTCLQQQPDSTTAEMPLDECVFESRTTVIRNKKAKWVDDLGMGSCRQLSITLAEKNGVSVDNSSIIRTISDYYCNSGETAARCCVFKKIQGRNNVVRHNDEMTLRETSLQQILDQCFIMNNPNTSNVSQYLWRPYKCTHCDRKFRNPKMISLHRVVHPGCLYCCPQCGLVFLDRKGLTVHEKIHGRAVYACVECGKHFPNRCSLEAHKKTVRNHKKDWEHFVCLRCGDYFPTKQFLLLHEEKVHCNDGFFACDKCSERYEEVGMLMAHSASHYLPCSRCRQSFSNIKQLSLHERQHDKRERFNISCDSFEWMTTSRRNSQIEITPDPVARRLIGMCVPSDQSPIKQELVEIKQEPIHCIEELFACDKCNEKFSSQANFKLHMVSHRLHCSHCKLTFAYLANWKNHQNIHGKQCTICNRSFKTRSGFKSHSRICKPGIRICAKDIAVTKLLECKVCKMPFKYRSQLALHEARHDKKLQNDLKTQESVKSLAELLPTGLSGSETIIFKTNCIVCGGVFKSLSAFRIHEQKCGQPSVILTPISKLANRFSCSKCTAIFRYRTLKRAHEIRKHMLGRDLKCYSCKRNCSSYKSLLIHKLTVCACRVNSIVLRRHVQPHSVDARHEKTLVAMHEKDTQNIRLRYECKECHRTFKDICKLQQHEGVHRVRNKSLPNSAPCSHCLSLRRPFPCNGHLHGGCDSKPVSSNISNNFASSFQYIDCFLTLDDDELFSSTDLNRLMNCAVVLEKINITSNGMIFIPRDDNWSVTIYQCPNCDKLFDDISRWRLHQLDSRIRRYMQFGCSRCGTMFNHSDGARACYSCH